MLFGRKKKVPVRKSRVDVDQMVITTAKTIGTAIGTASGAVEIGRQSAAQARKIDADELKQATIEKGGKITHKAEELRKQAVGQAKETKKMAALKADQAKELAAVKGKQAPKAAALKAEEAKQVALSKADEAKKKAGDKVDELRESAANKIAPKRNRGLLTRLFS
jgi:small subunit ribosomal protein S3